MLTLVTLLRFNFRGRVTPPRLQIRVDVVFVLDVDGNGGFARTPLNSEAIRKLPNTESNVRLTIG